ncbi:metal ABC transporter permease [Enterovirga sp.]|uniref:metal ABC transporter permease n=1 Tax=Enterovirga sp. TaxID=2026350 RepID=UPI00262EDF18|nr:metal ABC transporter permease [Enterovirga sp.]
MRRALVGCLALSLSAPPIGVFLVLRRMSLMSDAMSHAIMPGAAAGFLVAGLSVPAMTAGGLLAGMTVAVLAGLVARRTILREDASLAAFYLVSIAAGVALVSTRGSNVDLLHFLFGTVLALDDEALLLLGGVATVTLVWLAVAYRALVIECVDPHFLRLSGPASAVTHLSFLAVAVLNLVAAFQALGTLLAVGLMILPAVAARFWAESLPGLIAVAVLVAAVSSVAGLCLSYLYGLPSGPAIILSAGAVYGASMLFGRVGGLVRTGLPGRPGLSGNT